MNDVTVVVATYGSPRWGAWGALAAENVVSLGVPIVRLHEPHATLAQVRNRALSQVGTERVCFLDGDDGLAPGYFDRDLHADIIVTPLDGAFPKVGGHAHECGPTCLLEGNYIHIGAIARTALLKKVGGFREHRAYEDWDLWLRCYYEGATFSSSPGPSYVTRTQGVGGRNEALSPRERRIVRSSILKTAVSRNPTGA